MIPVNLIYMFQWLVNTAILRRQLFLEVGLDLMKDLDIAMPDSNRELEYWHEIWSEESSVDFQPA